MISFYLNILLSIWIFLSLNCHLIIKLSTIFICVLISVQSAVKLTPSKVAGIIDSKVGVATCITKADSTNLPHSQSCETLVKQPIPSTSDVSQPSATLETEVKQTSSLSFSSADSSAGVSNDKGLISLHEDEPSLQLRAREARQHVGQMAQKCVGLDSAATCSDNCVNLQTETTSSSSDFSQVGMDLLFVFFV